MVKMVNLLSCVFGHNKKNFRFPNNHTGLMGSRHPNQEPKLRVHYEDPEGKLSSLLPIAALPLRGSYFCIRKYTVAIVEAL